MLLQNKTAFTETEMKTCTCFKNKHPQNAKALKMQYVGMQIENVTFF